MLEECPTRRRSLNNAYNFCYCNENVIESHKTLNENSTKFTGKNICSKLWENLARRFWDCSLSICKMMYATQMYNRYKHPECFGSWYIWNYKYTPRQSNRAVPRRRFVVITPRGLYGGQNTLTSALMGRKDTGRPARATFRRAIAALNAQRAWCSRS